MENLSKLEIDLLKSIIEENKKKYPFLESHFPLLKVKSREFTGVGLYSNFEYREPTKTSTTNDLLSSKKRLLIPGLEHELSYVLDITNGQINHLEIVTNDNEVWNGQPDEFTLQ